MGSRPLLVKGFLGLFVTAFVALGGFALAAQASGSAAPQQGPADIVTGVISTFDVDHSTFTVLTRTKLDQEPVHRNDELIQPSVVSSKVITFTPDTRISGIDGVRQLVDLDPGMKVRVKTEVSGDVITATNIAVISTDAWWP